MPANTSKLPMDNEAFRNTVFLKTCIVKDGTIEIDDHGTRRKLKSDCLNNLNGLTVLLHHSLEIDRSGKQIGRATEIEADPVIE